MVDVLRIKRRLTGAAGAPAALGNAELAFNEVDNTLYYGKGGTPAAAASVIALVTAGAAAGATITIGDTPPASPSVGALWWDSVAGQLYLYYQDPTGPPQWVVAINQGMGAAVISDTAPTSPIVGSLWFDSVSCQMFIWYQDPTGAPQWVSVSGLV